MDDIYVLDKDLKLIGIVDSYSSLIWANRYNEDGDCEIYIVATIENVQLLQKNYYLTKKSDDMICKITKIEISTDTENGNFLIVTGIDAKNVLSQRIIWNTFSYKGEAEDCIYKLIDISILNPDNLSRKMLKSDGKELLVLANKNGYVDNIVQQVSYKQLEEKIQDICRMFGWGYRVYLKNEQLVFRVYRGEDRSKSVVFSDKFENLISTSYKYDVSNQGNVALIAGEGEGSKRIKSTIGEIEGRDRFEIFVDAKDISTSITYSDLIVGFPNGKIKTINGEYVYQVEYADIMIYDENQLEKLRSEYVNGEEIIIDDESYYRVYDANIAKLEKMNPSDEDSVVLTLLIYESYLLNKGKESLAEYGTITSFEGSIEPNTTFEYKKDYFLGDLVTVKNEYGISAKVRIVEIVETIDENGRSVEPKFEYVEVSDNV